MKAILIMLGLFVAYVALKDGLFASLTSGAPYRQQQRWFSAQTPYGNFGGGF